MLRNDRTHTPSLPARTIITQGFIAGNAQGRVFVFERTEDNDYYHKQRTVFNDAAPSPVASIAINGSEEIFIYIQENALVYMVNLAGSILRVRVRPSPCL